MAAHVETATVISLSQTNSLPGTSTASQVTVSIRMDSSGTIFSYNCDMSECPGFNDTVNVSIDVATTTTTTTSSIKE